jgi:hypothetical protein
VSGAVLVLLVLLGLVTSKVLESIGFLGTAFQGFGQPDMRGAGVEAYRLEK